MYNIIVESLTFTCVNTYTIVDIVGANKKYANDETVNVK